MKCKYAMGHCSNGEYWNVTSSYLWNSYDWAQVPLWALLSFLAILVINTYMAKGDGRQSKTTTYTHNNRSRLRYGWARRNVTRPDTWPIGSRLRMGRDSNECGQGQYVGRRGLWYGGTGALMLTKLRNYYFSRFRVNQSFVFRTDTPFNQVA